MYLAFHGGTCGDIPGQYPGPWDITDMGPYRVLVCFMVGGTCGDIPGQYPGRWDIMDMGPHRVLVCFMVVPVGTSRDVGTLRTWDHTVYLAFHGGTCGDIPGQYPGRWDIMDMGPHRVLVCFMVVPVGISRDNTRDVGTLRTWDHTVYLAFHGGTCGDIPGQYPGRWDITDMGPHRVLGVSWRYLWGHPGTIPGTLGHNGHGTTPCTCVFHGGTCGDIPGQYLGRWDITDMGPHRVLVCFMVGGTCEDIPGQYNASCVTQFISHPGSTITRR